MLRLDAGELRSHAFHHVDFACPLAAYDLETDHRLPVKECRAALFGDGVLDLRHLIEPDAAAVGKRDLHARQFRGGFHRGDQAHRLFRGADVGSAAETAILDNVREYDPDLAQKILDEMFVFENLMDLDDRGIQTLLREVQSDSLVIALKGAPPEMREKIFKNMSQRAAEMLREDLESRGPVRLSEVEAEQKEILKTARRLAEEGQIALSSKGSDDAFV